MYHHIKCAGIYKITIGEYYYIGCSVDIFARWQSHYTSLKMDKHHSPLLQSKFNEYDITECIFSILEYISLTSYKSATKLKGNALKNDFRKNILNREKWWMSQYSKNFSLNSDNKHFK
jgi:hypothetical protein